MAATKIADVIVPEVFNPYTIQRTTEQSALYQSGIIQPVEGLNVLGQTGGTTIAMPFWNDLTGDEEILSDTTPLGVAKITASQDVAVLHARGKAWGVNDLAKALSGDDPLAAIGDLVGAYWARRWQVMLLSTLKGIFASGDLNANRSDISAASGEAAVIGADTTVDAIYKLGDAAGGVTGFAMHSAVVAKLVKDDLIDFALDSQGKPTIPVYLGKSVIVDDGMPVASGVYTSYLFGQGAIGLGEGNAPTPTETDRDSLQGEDILINRRHFVLHPRGMKWVGTPAGVSPTNAELETGANWDRAYDPKNIRIVQFTHRVAPAA
ncbi:major capsid protein [Xanthobacteraceae bacterium A53D]